MNKAFTGVVSTVETITPQLAKAYLEKNKDNRKTSRHRIGIYSRDMRSGKWTPGSPISFFDNGDLADGQHRLLAVVEADVPVVFVVVRNLPIESRLVHNSGMVQTAAANIQMYTGSNHIHGVLVHKATAFVRTLIEVENSKDASVLSASELVEKIDCVSESLEFVAPYVARKRKGISAAAIWAAVMAAFYVVDKNRLLVFCDVFAGKRNAVDSCEAMVMRLAQIMTVTDHAGAGTRQDVFMKTQRCIKAFLDNQSLTKFYTSEGVIYSAKERLGFPSDK